MFRTQIKAIVFDVDGVITDGKRYITANSEIKTISLKDLDAINLFKAENYIIGVVTGEDTEFSHRLEQELAVDFFISGCKKKDEAIEKVKEDFQLSTDEICYIGDGKYDIAALKNVGLPCCPKDAINEVKCIVDIILERNGGDGCIAELYSILHQNEDNMQLERSSIAEEIITRRIREHRDLIDSISNNALYLRTLSEIAELITQCYVDGRKVLLCGNGGSAADAQHLAGELVGRFYLERRALSAEALNVNTSIITAIGNDYSYDRIFAREVEAKGKERDVLIGISTSGRSHNIVEAFKAAKEKCLNTVLFTGKLVGNEEIIMYTDSILSVPSKDTPRIQEMHILAGHIICEIVERKIVELEKKEEQQYE